MKCEEVNEEHPNVYILVVVVVFNQRQYYRQGEIDEKDSWVISKES